jgi:hypothetical protein
MPAKIFNAAYKAFKNRGMRSFALSTLVSGSFLTTSLLKLAPANARPSLPMYVHVLAGIENGAIRAELIVPDQNTTVPIKGSKLRRYDAHIAKMFELTNHECQDTPQREWNNIMWQYSAGDGKINMGFFDISCDRAREIASAYGLGQSQRTEVYYHKARNLVNVATLKISGNNTSKWLKFVQSFPPEFGD